MHIAMKRFYIYGRERERERGRDRERERERERDFLRFLWVKVTNSSETEITIGRFKWVTFGGIASQFLLAYQIKVLGTSLRGR